MSCDVSPRTLKSPPAQKCKPKTSLSTLAMLGVLRPSTSRQRFSIAARRALYPFAIPSAFFSGIAAFTENMKDVVNDGETSPASRRRFQSSALARRFAQALSSLTESVPASREGSIFQRSVTCSVRW